MDLIAYLLLLAGNATMIYASDGLCLPPARVEGVIATCPANKPYQNGEVRIGGKWVPNMVYPQHQTLGLCFEYVCVKPAPVKPVGGRAGLSP